MTKHSAIAEIVNDILLLSKINTVLLNLQSTKYSPHTINYCKIYLYTYRQDTDTLVPDYHNSFGNNIDVSKHNVGTF